MVHCKYNNNELRKQVYASYIIKTVSDKTRKLRNEAETAKVPVIYFCNKLKFT